MTVLKLPTNWGNVIGMRIPIIVSLFLSILSAEPIVYHVPIQGVIDLGLPPFIERTIAAAEEADAAAIIFDIDTFGGRVDAATQIKDAILGSDVLTVAFINRRAISAGALISLSCEKIYMTGGGTIGAATAVDQEAAVVPVEADPHLHVKAPPHVPAIPESSQNAINLSAHKLAGPHGPASRFINQAPDRSI